MPDSLTDIVLSLQEQVRELSDKLNNTGYDFKKLVTSEIKRTFKIQPQAETMFGMFTAMCVDTVDHWKQNRVRFFSPLLHIPETPVTGLDFAWPISSMGGFDDSGLNWVPPAGSTLCIVFENGSRSTPFYLGTTWHRNRGADGEHNWGYNIDEYYQVHEGHRKGYLLGPNDGSQVLPPWNTESYNGIDLNSKVDYDSQPESAKKRITYPNIYGFKTPQKHLMKMVDGNYKCHHKHKRMELLSSNGNWLIFKDDHLHEFLPGGGGRDTGNDQDDNECKSHPNCRNLAKESHYFKHENELRPWRGPQTPQNNKAQLPQSGVQMLSVSGHTWFMDDSVEQPDGIPNWERVLQPFSFGCTNKFLGHMYFVSATGHRIEMDDKERDTNVRSDTNRIRLLSACGHLLEMNDDSKTDKIAGPARAITMRSTSRHVLELYDGEDFEQAMPRREGGQPVSKAKNAYVSLRTGYGLEIMMEDAYSQEKTQQQNIWIWSPQRDNKERGPHFLHFQEVPSGAGQVFLRVGGNYLCTTYDNHYTYVGTKKNPSDLVVSVTKNTLIATENNYRNSAGMHFFDSKSVIVLAAGRDCPTTTGDLAPCMGRVLVLTDNGVVASDRIYGSASPGSEAISIFHLLPFHQQNSSANTPVAASANTASASAAKTIASSNPRTSGGTSIFDF